MRTLTAGLVLFLFGCDGQIIERVGSATGGGTTTGEGGGTNAAEVNPFTCDPTERPSELNAKRLSRTEYVNAVRSLVERALGPADAAALVQQVNLTTRLPAEIAGAYSTSDTNFSVIHATEYFGIADAVSTALVAPASYSRFVTTYVGYAPGNCSMTSVDTLSPACRTVLIKNFLLRAFGRPVEEGAANANDELASFEAELALAPTSRAAVEALIAKALMSPQFLFHLQVSLGAPAGEVYPLTSHAIARRLAFAFTQTLPDEELLAMAASSDLREDEAFARALAHVAPGVDSVASRFALEWLHLDHLPPFTDQTHPKAQRIAQGIAVNDALRDAMRDEVLDLVRYTTATNGTLNDLLTSDVSFARSPSLMAIYGQTAPAPANVTPQNAVRFPRGERSGLLTRAAMLMSGGHSENPIIRGIHVRRMLLCLPTPVPMDLPPNALAPPAPDAQLTTRERYHNKTSVQPCVGCHQLINPVGFALSKYNALGAYQPMEPVYDANATFAGELPTDATANLRVAIGVDREVTSGPELSEALAGTASIKACVARNFFTYVNGLQELPTSNRSCGLERMFSSLSSGSALREFFLSSAADRRFRHRTLRSAP